MTILANLQNSIGDISGETFLHVNEDHPDADSDGGRDGEDEDGADGLKRPKVGLGDVESWNKQFISFSLVSLFK